MPEASEKMDLDVAVSRLTLLKNSFLNQKYELEDQIRRYIPAQITKNEHDIAEFEEDLKLVQETRLADSSAIVYTMVETAKANGLEPWLYLRCILDELRYLKKTPAAATLEQYMPWSPCIREMMDKYKQSAFDRHQS